MSKKKRRTIIRVDVTQSILRSLRADFHFDEEYVDLIDKALQRLVPPEILDYMNQALQGNVPLPLRHPIDIDMGDGDIQRITVKNTPITLLLDYLCEKYGWTFGSLYWAALTSSTPNDFYEYLKIAKDAPITKKHILEEDK